jgi:tRNA pseudouridine38-40 synthase
MRSLIELAFKGTAYHGWQIQKNAHSVQSELQNVLSTILNEPIETVGCGRTDSGVHARQFFAHFDSKTPLDKHLLSRINSMLPPDIAVKGFREVGDDFSARYDARKRSYEYHILHFKDPFRKEFSCFMTARPDIEKMNGAALILFEFEDFSAFSKSNTQVNHNNCTIHEALWVKENDELVFYITANRFLRNMVRAIVGTLLRVGKGEISADDFRKVIESKSRVNAGTSVPAAGLFLTRVEYPQF